MFNALVLTQVAGKTQAHIQALTTDDLPAGDVLIAVDYSSLNYLYNQLKDLEYKDIKIILQKK